jgi:hypothetical protein
MPPVYCLNCGRYVDPAELVRNDDGSYSRLTAR